MVEQNRKQNTHKLVIDKKTGRTIDIGEVAKIKALQAPRARAKAVITPMTARQKLGIIRDLRKTRRP